MALFEIDSLLDPVSAEQPAGQDLEYDQEFDSLLIKAKGTPDRVVIVKDAETGRDVEQIIPGEQPDARAVLDAALALFKRTKDLRVAVHAVYGATCIEGLPGFASGTELLARMLERYWDDVHPRLDPDDGLDPFMRINVLNGLCDPLTLIRALKGVPFAEARAVGRFVLRDIDVANGDASAMEGQVAATPELLRAACGEMDPLLVGERQDACRSALNNLALIVSVFSERTSATPDFTPLKKIIGRAATIYGEAGGVQQGGNEAEAPTAEAGEIPVERQSGGKIATRADVKRTLEQVCDYLERTEPAHPAPLLIRRAARLLDMNFLDIMRELTPGTVGEIEHIAGIKGE
ncbi:MAG: type VI secretion-associated protein ImpA family [Gallionellaceae bacterium]|jgi:type VI secretion system protein ImpA|nr:MAG: type VI secretion-associated protein ImpA family [Gallionellaceae bacterium]